MTVNPEVEARQRAKNLTDLLWHVGTFVVIIVFLVLLDLLVGEPGLQWSYWIALFWGFALAMHAVAYWVGGRGLEERKTQQYLEEGRQQTTSRG